MADLDGHEVEAALPAFRRLHDTAEPAALHAMARLLGRWAHRPVGRALVPALEALLDEAAVGDLNKLAAAALLETHGQPVDYPRLMGRLRDLGAVAAEMRAAVLAAAARPAAAANVLEKLTALPPAALHAWIDDLRASRDPRALAILGPLVWAADPDVAVAAVAAIEAHPPMGPAAAAAGVALALAAATHADPMVRRQAGLTAARRGVIGARPGEGPPSRSTGAGVSGPREDPMPRPGSPDAAVPAKGTAPRSARTETATPRDGSTPRPDGLDTPVPDAAPSSDPVTDAAALLAAAGPTAVDVYASGGAAAGARLALVVWPDPARRGTFDVLTLHLAGGRGIQQYALVEGVSADQMADLMGRLADGGVPVKRLAAAGAARLLLTATADTLAHDGAAGLGFAVWPQAWLLE